MTSIGVFGLGLIGSALAGRLIAAGYDVAGRDLSADRCAELEARGGTVGTADEILGCRRRLFLRLRHRPTGRPDRERAADVGGSGLHEHL